MKLLLDTHAFLWLSASPEKLSANALSACEDSTNEIYLSLVTPWEIQIKQQLGKLHCEEPLPTLITTHQQQNGLCILPILLNHIYALSCLPRHHNDPFDRLLIAQAITESMTLVTVDKNIEMYSTNPLIESSNLKILK
jgi:PIN domain nuclease of toxin-antitoxin system